MIRDDGPTVPIFLVALAGITSYVTHRFGCNIHRWNANGEIMCNLRGEEPAITWKAARIRTDQGARVSGDLAELLEGQEVTEYAARGPDPSVPEDMPAIDELLRSEAVRLKLERLGIAFPDFEEMDVLMVWSAGDPPTRRAWFVLMVLADRRCKNRTPGSSRFDAPTDHLVRPGGFYPADIAWMAGLRTSEHHRLERVIRNLERFGVLKERPKAAGKTTRYSLGARPRGKALRELLTEERRSCLLGVSRLIRECVPSPGAKTGTADEWEALRMLVPGGEPFIVGTTSPSRRAFLERELRPLCRRLAQPYRPPAGRLRIPKWWLDAHDRGAHSDAVLIVPL